MLFISVYLLLFCYDMFGHPSILHIRHLQDGYILGFLYNPVTDSAQITIIVHSHLNQSFSIS